MQDKIVEVRSLRKEIDYSNGLSCTANSLCENCILVCSMLINNISDHAKEYRSSLKNTLCVLMALHGFNKEVILEQNLDGLSFMLKKAEDIRAFAISKSYKISQYYDYELIDLCWELSGYVHLLQGISFALYSLQKSSDIFKYK